MSIYPFSARQKQYLQGIGLAFAACALGSCATLSKPSAGTQWLAPDAIAVTMAHGFDNARVRAVSYENPSEYEQYIRMHEADDDQTSARTELLIDTTVGTRTALDVPEYQLQKLAQTWRFNQAPAQLEYGKTRSVTGTNGAYRYRTYRHVRHDTMRECISFAHSWDHPPDDPHGRPGKVLFGYYCAAANQALSEADIQALLTGIDIHEMHPMGRGYGHALKHEDDALQWAQGQAADDFGNSRFPFQFTRYYVVPGEHPIL